MIDSLFDLIYPTIIFEYYPNEVFVCLLQENVFTDFYRSMQVIKGVYFVDAVHGNDIVEEEEWRGNEFWGYGYNWREEEMYEDTNFLNFYQNGVPRFFYKGYYRPTVYNFSSRNQFWLDCSFVLNGMNEPLVFSDFVLRRKEYGVFDTRNKLSYAAYMAAFLNDIKERYDVDTNNRAFRDYYRDLNNIVSTRMHYLQKMSNYFSKLYIETLRNLKYLFFFSERPMKIGFDVLTENGYLVKKELKKENGLYFFLNNSLLFSKLGENTSFSNYVWDILPKIYGEVRIEDFMYLSDFKKESIGSNSYLRGAKGGMPDYSYLLSHLVEEEDNFYENFLALEEFSKKLKERKKLLGLDLKKYMGDLGIQVRDPMEFLERFFDMLEEYRYNLKVLEDYKKMKVDETAHFMVLKQPKALSPLFGTFYELVYNREEEFLNLEKSKGEYFTMWTDGDEEWPWDAEDFNVFDYLDYAYTRPKTRDLSSKFFGYPVTVLDYSMISQLGIKEENSVYSFYEEEIPKWLEESIFNSYEEFVDLVKGKEGFGVEEENFLGETDVEVRVQGFLDNSGYNVKYSDEIVSTKPWEIPVKFLPVYIQIENHTMYEGMREVFFDVEGEYGIPYKNGVIVSNMGGFRTYGETGFTYGLENNFVDIIRENVQEIDDLYGYSPVEEEVINEQEELKVEEEVKTLLQIEVEEEVKNLLQNETIDPAKAMYFDENFLADEFEATREVEEVETREQILEVLIRDIYKENPRILYKLLLPEERWILEMVKEETQGINLDQFDTATLLGMDRMFDELLSIRLKPIIGIEPLEEYKSDLYVEVLEGLMTNVAEEVLGELMLVEKAENIHEKMYEDLGQQKIAFEQPYNIRSEKKNVEALWEDFFTEVTDIQHVLMEDYPEITEEAIEEANVMAVDIPLSGKDILQKVKNLVKSLLVEPKEIDQTKLFKRTKEYNETVLQINNASEAEKEFMFAKSKKKIIQLMKEEFESLFNSPMFLEYSHEPLIKVGGKKNTKQISKEKFDILFHMYDAYKSDKQTSIVKYLLEQVPELALRDYMKFEELTREERLERQTALKLKTVYRLCSKHEHVEALMQLLECIEYYFDRIETEKLEAEGIEFMKEEGFAFQKDDGSFDWLPKATNEEEKVINYSDVPRSGNIADEKARLKDEIMKKIVKRK
jgi:hypothetical protein